MTGSRTLIAGLIGVVALGAAVALLLPGGEAGRPVTSEPLSGTAETTSPVTEPSLAEGGADDPVADECSPDPGIEVVATGPIEGFPPEEEVDGIIVVGSTARVDFRIDAPGNRNLILFRLVYIETNEVHGWTEVGWYQDSELTFDRATQRLTGSFRLSHTVDATAPGQENPERVDIDLVYEPATSRLSGTVAHPETTFALDLAAREGARDFFADPSCYPTTVEEPG